MKRISIILVLSLALVACGTSEEGEEKKELTYDEKVEAVCDCFENSNKEDFMKCAKLQHDYSESLAEDKRQEFLLTTNQCM